MNVLETFERRVIKVFPLNTKVLLKWLLAKHIVCSWCGGAVHDGGEVTLKGLTVNVATEYLFHALHIINSFAYSCMGKGSAGFPPVRLSVFSIFSLLSSLLQYFFILGCVCRDILFRCTVSWHELKIGGLLLAHVHLLLNWPYQRHRIYMNPAYFTI